MKDREQPSSFRLILNRLKGSTVVWPTPEDARLVMAVRQRERELKGMRDDRLTRWAGWLKMRAGRGESLDKLLPDAFAGVREATRRALDLDALSCQILAGHAMYQGRVAEMAAGEGKTLAALFPAFLHALTGEGVHILTPNDFLARRDAAWAAPIFEMLGMKVAVVTEDLELEQRPAAYLADITYATAIEVGCDYLRDGANPEDRVQRPFHVALVDEADTVLIDDAQTPLVLKAGMGSDAPARKDGLDSVTIQHLMGLYPKLAGMTATAQSAEKEFKTSYNLGITVIPPHQSCLRVDQADEVFTCEEDRDQALVNEIRRVHETGRPVLVGTLSVEASETLGKRLEAEGLKPRILNGINHEDEARVMAETGALGALTLAVDRAARGVEVKPGGPDGSSKDGVIAMGGLYVLGAGCRENQRMDRRLRGWTARKGDPGETRCFVSLSDAGVARYKLMRLLPKKFGAILWPLIHGGRS